MKWIVKEQALPVAAHEPTFERHLTECPNLESLVEWARAHLAVAHVKELQSRKHGPVLALEYAKDFIGTAWLQSRLVSGTKAPQIERRSGQNIPARFCSNEEDGNSAALRSLQAR